MTIRNKAVITLAVGTLIMMASSIFFTTKLFSEKMDQLEIEKASLDIERVEEAINSEISNLNSKTADWAVWDDSYKFVQDKNKEYIASNLEDSASFESLRLNFMIFVNSDGEIIYQKGFDQVTKEEDIVPEGINKYLVKDESLLDFKDINDSKSGMLLLPEGIFIVSSRPVIASNAEGPAKGVIVFGRYFNDREVEAISKITKQSKIEIDLLTDEVVEESGIKIVDEKNLDGIRQIKDVFGTPIAHFHVNIPRDIHLQGVEGIKYLTSFLIGISITFFAFVLLFLTKFVLSPIKNITNSVNLIANTKDFASRVSALGNDEFGLLSKNINTMLDSLQMSKDMAFSEAEKSRSFFDVVSGIVVIIDKNRNVTTINKKGAEFLGYETSDVIGKHWVESFVPENERESVNSIFNKLIGSEETKDDSYHENNVLLKSGKTALIGWHNSLLKDQNGEVIATVSHGEDITLKKEEEIKDSKQREESERLNQLMMGRELKMVELKSEIERLKSNAH